MKNYSKRTAWEIFFLKARFERAFTLIELMIAVAIVAVLASVAMGEYTQHLQKTRRIDAKLALNELAGFMERHYAINGRYTAPGNPNTVPVTLPFSTVPQGATGNDVMYSISFPTSPAPTLTTYQLNAVPREDSPQAGDMCGTLTINHLGIRGMVVGAESDLTLADCW